MIGNDKSACGQFFRRVDLVRGVSHEQKKCFRGLNRKELKQKQVLPLRGRMTELFAVSEALKLSAARLVCSRAGLSSGARRGGLLVDGELDLQRGAVGAEAD